MSRMLERQVGGWAAIWICGAAVLLGNPHIYAAASTDSGQVLAITLRKEVSAVGQEVRLEEVARVAGGEEEQAQKLRGVVVGRFAEGEQARDITEADVRAALDRQRVNWGKVMLKGHMACRVTRGEQGVQSAKLKVQSAAEGSRVSGLGSGVSGAEKRVLGAETKDAGVKGGEPVKGISVDTAEARSLRAMLVQWIAQRADLPAEALQLTFRASDDETLDQAVGSDRWELEPLNTVPLGRTPLVVRQWRGQKLANTYRLMVDVAWRALALVAAKPLDRGQTLGPSDVRVTEVLLDRAGISPLDKPAQAIGKTLQTSLKAGGLVLAGDLRDPLLVRRGDIVQVRVNVGGMVLRSDARAMEDGQLGQSIQVRNETSREVYAVVVTDRKMAALADATSEKGTLK